MKAALGDVGSVLLVVVASVLVVVDASVLLVVVTCTVLLVVAPAQLALHALKPARHSRLASRQTDEQPLMQLPSAVGSEFIRQLSLHASAILLPSCTHWRLATAQS